MTLVNWQPEFSTGIEEVDYEHRELIDLINDSFAEARKTRSSAAVLQSLGEIHAKISAHFALEEKVMRAGNYVHFREHKDDHEHLLDVICDFMDEYADQQAFDEAQFGQRLEQWFVGHFSTHDALLHGKFKDLFD